MAAKKIFQPECYLPECKKLAKKDSSFCSEACKDIYWGPSDNRVGRGTIGGWDKNKHYFFDRLKELGKEAGVRRVKFHQENPNPATEDLTDGEIISLFDQRK